MSPDKAGAIEGAGDSRDQLLASLKNMDPAAFERLCQRLLRESGFVKVEVTGKAGNGGIDGVGVLRMNLISFQVLFQCKRYAGAVSSPTVRDFRGAMQGPRRQGTDYHNRHIHSRCTTRSNAGWRAGIDLVDGELLCQLLRERRLGVLVREVHTEEVSVDVNFLATI